MAATTLIQQSLTNTPGFESSISSSKFGSGLDKSLDSSINITTTMGSTTDIDEATLAEAAHLASLCKAAMATILGSPIDPKLVDQSDKASMLALPLHKPSHRITDAAAGLPRRKSARASLAVALANLLFPLEAGTLAALIRYEGERKRIRDYVVLQRRFDIVYNTARNDEAPLSWDARVRRQGPWSPSKGELKVLKMGAPALPMPVRVPERYEFEPFLEWVAAGGTHELPGAVVTREQDEIEVPDLDSDSVSAAASSTGDHDEVVVAAVPVLLGNGAGEDYYHTPGLEFRRGVLYEDARLDLCKQVVGPDHIGALMQALRTNTFVRHFLLGNNIIGPVGARAISDFIHDFPDRMDTWYLAGNCVDGAGFKVLVDAMVKSKSVTNIWLKRNPLGADSAKDLARLITDCENLRTLDLDQTELSDDGAAELFRLLAGHGSANDKPLPLRVLYLNAVGISSRGAEALGEFLASPAGAAVESVYMSCNPLTDAGAIALARHLPQARSLKRLVLQSTGISSEGAVAVCSALHGHGAISMLDLGHAYATTDLAAGFNYIADDAANALAGLVRGCESLRYLSLGSCALSFNGLACVMQSVADSKSLLVWQGTSVVGQQRNGQAGGLPLRNTKLPSLGWPVNTASMFDIDAAIAVTQGDINIIESRVRDTLERNVRARYGEDMSYRAFWDDEKRWVQSDRLDVRKIDSVYRTRDMRSARRGEMVLVKLWEEDDDTLERVMGQTLGDKPELEGMMVRGPVCPLKKMQLEQQRARMAAL
ncbi:NLR family CARD domain-containing 5 [Microdochium nivale]|nr:NLR family CARD domain-containing 5 [Microdochium nivale]